ncbi:MAG TPA: hypothetical protein VNM47_19220, partial [Terriglobia bacterium]|nr:hypothetical protein [Terriglobia bacterium]
AARERPGYTDEQIRQKVPLEIVDQNRVGSNPGELAEQYHSFIFGKMMQEQIAHDHIKTLFSKRKMCDIGGYARQHPRGMVTVTQVAEATVERHKLHAPVAARQLGLQVRRQARIAGSHVKNARMPGTPSAKIAVQQTQATRYTSQPVVNSPQVVKTLPNVLGCAEIIIKPLL